MPQENIFVRFGRLFIARPKLSLSILLLLFAMLVAQLPNIRVDTSAESFLLPNSPALMEYDKFRSEFGRDEFFVVIITGVDVFSLEFLQALRDFHEAIATHVTQLQSVESLVNVRSIYGEEDNLIAEDLLENFPTNAEELAIIKERVRAKDIYFGRLINREEDTVAIFVKQIPFTLVKNADGTETVVNLGDKEMARGDHELQQLAAQFKDRFSQLAKPGEIYIGGTPSMGSYMSTLIQRDFGVFTTVALLMIAFVLAVLFKRVSGVVIPLLVLALGVTSCIAMMPLLNFPMQLTTSIIPSFLMAACIGDAVHLLSIFYKRYDEGAEKDEALLFALNHVGIACLFTSLTTAAGLSTFIISEIQPIASLGLFAAIGSLLAFILTLSVIPIIITLTPLKRRVNIYADTNDGEMKKGSFLYKFTRSSIYLSINHPKKIVGVSLIILAITLVLIPQLRFSQDSLLWLPEDNPVRSAVAVIESKITGSLPVEIVIDTGVDQGALNPELLTRLDKWLTSMQGSKVEGLPILSINSLIDIVKETNQGLNGNDKSHYIIPDNQELIAQELLMVEMDQADDLYQFTDKNFRKLRVTFIMPWADAMIFEAVQATLTKSYNEGMGTQYSMKITGIIPIFSTIFSAMLKSAAESYILAGIAITFMMILLMRNVVDGLLCMFPNLLPILIVIAYMAVVDIPMDVLTVLIGSIALGLCVDDTVHFMHGFKMAYNKHGDAAKAIEDTLVSTGKALMITTIVLFWGFLTFTLSELSSMKNFGILTAMCVVMAIVFDFLLGPALMMLRYGRKGAK